VIFLAIGCDPSQRSQVPLTSNSSGKKKPQQGGWGELEAGASDLRDQYASRDRRYNEQPATLVPLAFAQMDVVKRAHFADGRYSSDERWQHGGRAPKRERGRHVFRSASRLQYPPSTPLITAPTRGTP
jgi:hypothetical protein